MLAGIVGVLCVGVPWPPERDVIGVWGTLACGGREFRVYRRHTISFRKSVCAVFVDMHVHLNTIRSAHFEMHRSGAHLYNMADGII